MAMGRNKNALKKRLKSVTTKQYTSYSISSNFDEAKRIIESNDNDAFINFLNNYRIDINDLGEINGPSLLMISTECGNIQIIRELIRRGADINYQDSDLWSALLVAVKEENIDIVIELLDAGADVETADCGGFSPLMWSSYKGNLELTKILLKRNANPNVYDLNHLSPLVWASGRGFLDIVVLLIGHGAKVDSPDKYGTTALIWASRKGYIEIVQKLIKAGANVDATGMFGWTALIVATRGNYEKVVENLLETKPNINASDAQGMTPLMTSAKEGNINIVNMLIHANSYVNLQDKNNDTSLIHACKSGHLNIVEALLKAHAAVDHQNDEKKTALYCAVEKGHIEVIKSLLKVNPNLELPTKDGDTCLMRAVRNRKLAIVKLLVDKKAKISSVDRYGDTILHIAARAQSKAILEFILRNPRNSQLLYKPNKNSETPFSIDCSHQKPILPTLFGAAPSSRRVLEKETQLGYDLYSSAIANLLSEPNLKLPICVGLFAKWGSGKSFLIDLLSFTKDWMIQYKFKFTWTLLLLTLMISSLIGAFTLVASLGRIYLALIITLSTFILIYLFLAIIYFGSSKYHWSISYNIKLKLEKLKLILQICFGCPPLLSNEQISNRPVRFLFTETPIKISTDYNVCQLISEIHRSLWKSIENKYGYLSIKLYKVFQPKPVNSSTWKWRRACGAIPNIFLFLVMFFTIVLGTSFIITEQQLTNIFKTYPTTSYIAVGLLSIAGAWVFTNILTLYYILRELIYPFKCKTREKLKKEVELMQSCIHALDAFECKKQNRLVIILDALESIYESDRLISFLEAVNINFLSSKPHQYTTIPFIIILTLDPHHHITPKSKEYLKTIVHLPFYLQNSQLRRVKIAQQTIMKASINEIKSSTTSLVDAITQAPLSSSDSYKFGSTGTTTFQKNKAKKSASLLKSSDSIVSLCGPGGGGEVPTKVLLTDDYFSDVNPKSMRRIMNIVYVQGRLLKAFNLEFSWHKLSTWIYITEQYPLRASSLIVFFEIYENKYTDDGIPLKMLYDKVCIILEQSKEQITHHMSDSDEKKLNAFLSLSHNSLTLADLKIFAPFAINLDPYLKKLVQEIFTENPLYNLVSNRPITPSNIITSNRPASITPLSTTVNQLNENNNNNNNNNNKSKLSELNVDGVISLLKQIDGFDLTMIDKYSQTLKSNNINGKVLASCSAQDLEDLKNVLKFTFGDWLLFKKIISENKQLTHLHTLAPSILPTTSSPYKHQTKTQQLSIQIEPTSIGNLTTFQPIMQSLPLNTIFTNTSAEQQLIETTLNSPIISNQNYLVLPQKPSNLEKQATMEEQALQSNIIEDDEENLSNDEDANKIEDDNEVDVLYLKNSSKVSPSASLVEEPSIENNNISQGLSNSVDANDLEPNDTTPLVSFPRRKLERQKQFD